MGPSYLNWVRNNPLICFRAWPLLPFLPQMSSHKTGRPTSFTSSREVNHNWAKDCRPPLTSIKSYGSLKLSIRKFSRLITSQAALSNFLFFQLVVIQLFVESWTANDKRTFNSRHFSFNFEQLRVESWERGFLCLLYWVQKFLVFL